MTNSTDNKAFAAPAAGEDKAWGRVLMLSLVLIFLAMTIMSFWYGLSGDEVDMNEYGKAILSYFTTFGSDQTVFNMPKEYDRDSVIKYYGGLFDLICAIVNKVSPFEEYTTRHILNAWAGFLAILFAAKIAVRAVGRQAGLICAWLMFLSPFFLGNAMNNPKDIPFAAAYIIAIFCIIRLFDRMPKPRITDYLWVILSIGAAINVRVAGILLIPYLFVYAAILFVVKNWFQGQQQSYKEWIKPVAIVAILGYLAGSLFWPYGLKNPISNPLTALSQMSNFKMSLAQLWDGERMFSSELPSDYLVKSFIFTNSYVLLAGLLAMLFFLWRARKHENGAIIYFIAFTGLFPIAYIIYGKSNVYHLWRHVLFVFPSFAVVSAFGLWYVSEWLRKVNFKYGIALVGLLMLEPLYFIADSFPNTITYFNGLVGGTKGAYTNYGMDFYYNSLKQDVDWFKKHELPKYKSTDTIYIVSNAHHLLVQYFKDEKNVLLDYVRYAERNQKKWDYSFFHIALIPDQEIRAKTWLPPTTLYKAQYKGCVFSAVAKRPSYDDLKGFEALQRNDIENGLKYLEAYVKADPNNIAMLSILANIYHQLQRDDIAKQYADRANALLLSNQDEME